MKVSVNWLRHYVDIENIDIKTLGDKLSLAGLEVGGKTNLLKVTNVVTAEVLSKVKHPNADKLSLCSVSDGEKEYQVVCGAPNVEAGQKVAFAKIGAKLPEVRIKEAKIRGVESFGMLCSERELGLSTDHSGILVLSENTPLGVDINDILGLGDTILELNVTPNRPDWLSVIGVARETAAVFSSKLTLPTKHLQETGEKTKDKISVRSEDVHKCPIYAGRIIKGIKLAPSPFWLQNRLKTAGLRPINNVVDITNYILLEYGQPLHAFDLRMIDTGIIVRNARKGEKIIALNGKEYDLDEDMLIIADHSKPLGIAGIMGGEHTSILADTDTVFLECAYFEPTCIRKTSKRLGISSDSSYRYERGIDYGKTLEIADYAAEMIREICGGEVLIGIAGGVFAGFAERNVKASVSRINSLLGTDIKGETMSNYLNALQIPTKIEGDSIICNVPSFRGDILHEQSVAEEVARLFGYENIVTTVPVIRKDCEPLSPELKYTRLVRNRLESLGFTETVNFSFLNPDYLKIFHKEEQDYVKLLNPISSDMAWLRPYVLPAVLKNMQTNLNQGETEIRLFEVGSTFKSINQDELADENQKLCLCVTNEFLDLSWIKKTEADTFYYLKGVLENIIAVMGLNETYVPLADCIFLHPGKSAAVLINGENVGFIGAVHPDILEILDIKTQIYAAEVDLTKLANLAHAKVIKYEKFSRFPSVERDFAIVTDKTVLAGDVLNVVKSVSPIIKNVNLFDDFSGENIGEGKKSLAFRVRFSDLDKTLNDDDINPIIDIILEKLSLMFGAKLR